MKIHNKTLKILILLISILILIGITMKKTFASVANPIIIDYGIGNAHTITLDEFGIIWTWGKNDKGCLGHGNTTNYNTPRQILVDGNGLPLPIFVDVDAGVEVSFALDVNGDIWSWGANGEGQLGLGQSNDVYRPLKLFTNYSGNPLPKFKSIRASTNVLMAIDVNGYLWVSGSSYNGRNGNAGIPLNALKNTGVGNIASIARGTDISNFAVTKSGEVYAWGACYSYDMGPNFTDVAVYSIPTIVKTLGGGSLPFVKQLSSGARSTAILDDVGNIWTWGNNANGQLGRNTTSNTTDDQRALIMLTKGMDNGSIVTLPAFKFISHGSNYVVAVDVNGFLWTWGKSSTYETGLASTSDILLPTKIQTYFYPSVGTTVPNTQASFMSVCAHTTNTGTPYNFNLALDSTGHLWGFGNNSTSYNLANVGSSYETVQRPTPIQLYPPQAPTINSANIGDTTITGTGLKGFNITVTFPNSSTVSTIVQEDGTWSASVPVTVNLNSMAKVSAVQINAGLTSTSAITTVTPLSQTEIIDYGVGVHHTITLDKLGNMWTWGRNSNKCLGHGKSVNDLSSPKQVLFAMDGSLLPKFMDVDAASDATYALDVNGNIWSWGNPFHGQLGIGTDISQNIFAPLMLSIGDGGVPLPKFKMIKSGYNILMAVDLIGNLWISGYGSYNLNTDLGAADILALRNTGLSNIVNLAGDNNTCFAVNDQGQVYGWGNNGSYNLSPMLNNTLNYSTPALVTTSLGGALPFAKQIATAADTSVILDIDGNIWTWGNNANAMLGIGNITNTPAQQQTISKLTSGNDNGSLVTLPKFTNISAGANYVIAVDNNGFLWTWGNSIEIGQGSGGVRPIPTKIQTYSYPLIGSIVPNTQTRFVSSLGHSFIGGAAFAIDVNGMLWSWGSNSISFNNTGVDVGYAQITRPTPLNQFSALTPTINEVNVGDVNISGTGEPNLTVTITFTDGMTTRTTTVQSDGTWSIPVPINISLKPLGKITATQINVSGISEAQITNVKPVGITDIADFGVGVQHTITLDNKGNIWTWGRNNNGCLGQGNLLNLVAPKQLILASDDSLLPKFQDVEAASDCTYALDVNGDIWVWGNPYHGQLGIGPNISENILRPLRLTLGNGGVILPKFRMIKPGYNVLMAVDFYGNLWICGYGLNYLNTSPTGTDILSLKMTGLTDVIYLAGDTNTCFAVNNLGELYGWGNNSNYGLSPALSSGSSISTPTLIKTSGGGDLPFVKSIGTSGDASIILDIDGKIWTWGNNSWAMAGGGNNDNTATYQQTIKALVNGIDNGLTTLPVFTFMSASMTDVTCIDINGFLWTWGTGPNYNTGHGDVLTRNIPTKIQNYFYPCVGSVVSNTHNATKFVKSEGHPFNNGCVLALDTTGHLWSWGINNTSYNNTGVDISYSLICRPTPLGQFAAVAPTFNVVGENDVVITGKGTPLLPLTVTFPDGATTASTIVNSDGTWSLDVPENVILKGMNKFSATQTNIIGTSSLMLGVVEGLLKFNNVPSLLSFMPTKITPSLTTIGRDVFNLEVYDSRGPGGSWNITATIDSPLTSTRGHSLPNALVYIDENNVMTPLSNIPVKIFKYTTNSDRVIPITWNTDNGILLYLNLTEAYANEEYVTTIYWNLLDAPI